MLFIHVIITIQISINDKKQIVDDETASQLANIC